MTTSEIATVLAWHDALNASDIDTLIALSSDDIDVGDAHGAGQGHAALRDWAAGHPPKVEVGRIYVHDGVVVVEQKIGSAEDPGANPLSRQRFASSTTTSPRCFATKTWQSALAATELTDADLVD